VTVHGFTRQLIVTGELTTPVLDVTVSLIAYWPVCDHVTDCATCVDVAGFPLVNVQALLAMLQGPVALDEALVKVSPRPTLPFPLGEPNTAVTTQAPTVAVGVAVAVAARVAVLVGVAVTVAAGVAVRVGLEDAVADAVAWKATSSV